MSHRLRCLCLMILCFTLIVGALQVQAQTEPVVIDFYYATSADTPAAQAFARYAEEFNAAHPDIQVVPTFVGGFDDITPAVQSSIENGTPGPDVAVLLVVDLYTFIDNGYLVPAQQFIDQMEDGAAYVDDFFPAFMENSVDGEGTVWTIPFQRSTPILFYNKDMFREAGLDPDQPPTNRDELLSFAQQLNNEDHWGVTIPSAGFPYWLFQSFAIGNGQNVVGAAPDEIYFNAPAVVDGLEFFVSLSQEHDVMPEGAISFFDTDDDFLAEKTAMIYHTTGSLTSILNNAEFEVGVGFLPSGAPDAANQGYGVPTGGANLYIFSNTTPEEQAAAWEWVQFLSSPEIQADWTLNTGYIAARQSAWDTDTLLDLVEQTPAYAVARDQLQYAEKELTTYHDIEVRQIFNTALLSVIGGETDAQTALDTAQAQAEALIAE